MKCQLRELLPLSSKRSSNTAMWDPSSEGQAPAAPASTWFKQTVAVTAVTVSVFPLCLFRPGVSVYCLVLDSFQQIAFMFGSWVIQHYSPIDLTWLLVAGDQWAACHFLMHPNSALGLDTPVRCHLCIVCLCGPLCIFTFQCTYSLLTFSFYLARVLRKGYYLSHLSLKLNVFLTPDLLSL